VEIHKPKPVHNWREFLKEYAIIVLGVLTALAAEQAVEWLRWRHEVAIARQSLREEIAVIDRFYGRRALIGPCLERRLEEKAARIRDIAANHKAAPLPPDPGTTGALLSDAEWQSERSAQTLTHFPRAELALMSNFYAQMGDIHEWIFEEERSWSALAVLADDTDHLGPADLAQLRVNLNIARTREHLIFLNVRRQLAISAQLGIYPPGRAAYTATVARWCRPGEPLGQLPGQASQS